jgi:hypothetical protein
MTQEITAKFHREIAKLGLPEDIVASVEKTIQEDLILPTLDLVNSAICAEIIGDEVSVSIGPRDWQWDKFTGECVASGTCLW